ncbi:MAG: tetratricopeptide repeat protein [Woeseiaceae bacterium]|nr:tetratricopeptide repeat protein [Woeseiaceae bacterium]MDG1015841.1 tetratricopeptide repeat protein [Woeseiaceae bacterium]MDG1712497.1 tetratricopeptide repeat protein [Woeseiaceae bacterium]MDG1864816.1 tetratricopeptide repeat protein [Woeseiaceae bacterium]
MDEFLSEKEQIQYIRDWWRDNRMYIFIFGFVVIGSVAGTNTWKASVINEQIAASSLYESLAVEISENNLESGELIAEEIYSEYSESIYADQARLAMAYFYMSQSRDEDAAEELRGLIESSENNEMILIANMRLAKILLYQSKYQEVLDLLEGNLGHAFETKYSELIGDAYLGLEDYENAEFAYMNALKDTGSPQVIDAALLQMKINDLPQQNTVNSETQDESLGAES